MKIIIALIFAVSLIPPNPYSPEPKPPETCEGFQNECFNNSVYTCIQDRWQLDVVCSSSQVCDKEYTFCREKYRKEV
jgi:hypothetical protein